jgi:glyceraldehyde-3-phosphate dehydrogenase (ferredoxin)
MLGSQSVMGKYYVHYGFEFHEPRELGMLCVDRMVAELMTDNAGMCRFHRGWSEKLWPEIVSSHLALPVDYQARHTEMARQVHRQGKPVYWPSARLEQMVHCYLREVQLTSRDDGALARWLARFDADRPAAARAYWEELGAGIEQRFAG